MYPSCSLIISTYNQVKTLRLCLESVMAQQLLPNEVIVADDGSGESTRELVQHFASVFPVPLLHVWHPDEGFRLAAIRNKALVAANGDYIIQTDGDIILHTAFIRDHLQMARSGFFSKGNRVWLEEDQTRATLDKGILQFSLKDLPFPKWPNAVSCSFLQMGYRLLPLPVKGIIGCNMGYWKQDAFAANGYNEDFIGWGKEDDEFAIRLENNGIRKQAIKFGAVAYHLWHPVADRSRFADNDEIMNQTIRNRIRRCENGISLYQ